MMDKDLWGPVLRVGVRNGGDERPLVRSSLRDRAEVSKRSARRRSRARQLPENTHNEIVTHGGVQRCVSRTPVVKLPTAREALIALTIRRKPLIITRPSRRERRRRQLFYERAQRPDRPRRSRVGRSGSTEIRTVRAPRSARERSQRLYVRREGTEAASRSAGSPVQGGKAAECGSAGDVTGGTGRSVGGEVPRVSRTAFKRSVARNCCASTTSAAWWCSPCHVRPS
jgi:hypothetical protein